MYLKIGGHGESKPRRVQAATITALPRMSVLRLPAFPSLLALPATGVLACQRRERPYSITDGTLCRWSGDFSQRLIWRPVHTASMFVPPKAGLHRVHVQCRAAWIFIARLRIVGIFGLWDITRHKTGITICMLQPRSAR